MPEPTKRSSLFFKTLLPLVALAVGVMAYQYQISNPPLIEKKPLEAHYPTVEVVIAEPKDTEVEVYSQGTVRPRSETVLKPEVSGRVVWISPQLVNGGLFAEGEKLLEIDDTDYRTALASSKTAHVRAEVEFDHANRELKRIESLHRRNLASETQLDQARRSFRLAEATLNESRIQQQQAQTNLERTVIKAPFAGRVRKESVDFGQYLTQGENIATLYATDFYEVHLPIGIEQFVYLDIPPGTQGVLPPDSTLPVTIAGNIGTREFYWSGELQRTEGEIDAATRLVYGVVTVENKVLPNHPPLLVGMFVKAAIQGKVFPDVVTLPRNALRDNNQVLVVDENNRLHFRQVIVLRVQGDEVLIQSGLKPGEAVCISPLTVAVEGMRVNISPAKGV
ncbi:RND family efflux transporter MFP subunit [Litorivivens lipolytica]|uniref:RND family efflux transporter MFP subunit n=1 Tax=Litorivivens lipolytica TaxID=1524264 RepID=A0A7W4W3D6_9GAMM|nr:efflux RND transporter periplasmic adaptor subunit [Litorivivens lipolytica]MBB3046718.1 RND family efflux transporter MFP subunit [Litorivivens lipolytica]